MNTMVSPIKQFKVSGLHGDRNITLDFEGTVKILVNLNGAGKTTVLNILFHLLSGNLLRLWQFDFETMNISFSNGESVQIQHTDLELSNSENPIDILQSRLPSREFERMVRATMEYPPYEFERRTKEAFRRFNLLDLNLDVKDLREELKQRFLRDGKGWRGPFWPPLPTKLQDIWTRLQKHFPHQVLYFPTYRRIEEDLQNLGYVEPDFHREEQLIQFGMQDVKTRWQRITSEIRDSSVEWYSKINGEMATQLIRGIQEDTIVFEKLENPKAFRIVFDRIGNNMSEEDKQRILDLISSKKIKEGEYLPLAFFLSNLIKVYEQQSDNDNAIKEFVRVSSGYLSESDKEIRYDESRVEIKVVSKHTGKEISLDKLSSGEKQVVSIFSRLFLDKTKSYAILFDEPELSLSMEWQKKLLEDIVKSSKCAFLLAATHSPFIFENELDQYADQLKIDFLGTTNESCQ